MPYNMKQAGMKYGKGGSKKVKKGPNRKEKLDYPTMTIWFR